VRGGGSQRVHALGCGAEADRHRAELLLPRARGVLERDRARGSTQRFAVAGVRRPLAERHRDLHRARGARRQLEIPAQGTRRVREFVVHLRASRQLAAREMAQRAALLERRGAESTRLVERDHHLAAVHIDCARAPREIRDRARAAHALERLPRRRDLERPNCREQAHAHRRRTGVLDAVADARARVRAAARERSRREREVAPAPVRGRDRKPRLRERLRDVGVRPGHQLAVGEQERLEREAGAVGLDHPLLVHDSRGRATLDTDGCPVGLRAVQPARVQTAPLVRGHRMEEVVERARELVGLDAQRCDRESAAAGRLVQQQPQQARAPSARQIDVVARTLRLVR
jgi:hypothetical protein